VCPERGDRPTAVGGEVSRSSTGALPGGRPGERSARVQIVARYRADLGGAASGGTGRGGAADPWEQVRSALPLFPGHRQPHVPYRFGYYDPEGVESHESHYALAARYGVNAFSYELSWFPGSALRPQLVDRLAAHRELDLTYLVAWSPVDPERPGRRGSGWMERAGSGEEVAEHLSRYLSDERYLRVGGRPILVVDGGSAHPAMERVLDGIRGRCDQLGLGAPLLAVGEGPDVSDREAQGFDAVVETPLAGLDTFPAGGADDPDAARPYDPAAWHGRLGSYRRAMSSALARPAPGHRWFRSCVPAWDDTPRRGSRGTVLLGDSPELYGEWLQRVVERTYLWNAPEEWLVFAGTWNGWADGSYLEPDVDLGDGRLAAVRRAVVRTDRLGSDVLLATAQGRRALLDVARSYVESASLLARELLASGSPREPPR